MEAVGQKLIEVIDTAWSESFFTKSDFARAEADYIAVAASMGFITTQTSPEDYSRRWHVTPDGLRWLWMAKGLE